jgi:hypothetical protein
MTDDELHTFGVELVLVYYHYQKGDIKSRNVNPGIDLIGNLPFTVIALRKQKVP